MEWIWDLLSMWDLVYNTGGCDGGVDVLGRRALFEGWGGGGV